MTRALGRSPADFIVDSYYRLFLNRREQFGLTGFSRHALFGTVMIPALVLTAGLGTRLKPLSYVRAKGALPLVGRTARATHPPRAARRRSDRRGAQPPPSAAHVDARDRRRQRHRDARPLLVGDAGPRIGRRAAAARFRCSARTASLAPFLIVNGDTLTDVDVAALIADHRASGAMVTMAVIPNTQPDKYGGSPRTHTAI